MTEIVVMGAGMAGLTCARHLQAAGHEVVVLDKSRGVGGRVATRRLVGAIADHGARSLEIQGSLTQSLIQALQQQGILQIWTDQEQRFTSAGIMSSPAPHPQFCAPEGMTAIAKFLAQGLEVRRSQRVVAIAPKSDQTWQLTLVDDTTQTGTALSAERLILAIPAPQAVALLAPLADTLLGEFWRSLQSITFDPCLTAIATYSTECQPELESLPWRSLHIDHADARFRWIGMDSSKRLSPSPPVCVVHSTANFAERHLEADDLGAIGRLMLEQAAEWLLPWLREPEQLQVHRWRYAFPRTVLSSPFLAIAEPIPLCCVGDWCLGQTIEAAMQSGLAAAQWLVEQ